MTVIDSRPSFPLAYWQNNWVFDVTLTGGSSQAFLVASSPADGLLSSGQMTSVVSDIQTAIEALTGVTGCTTSAVTCSLPQPWASEGAPSLVFDSTWTVYGYQMSNGAQAWFAFQSGADAHTSVATAFGAQTGVSSVTTEAQPTVSPSGL